MLYGLYHYERLYEILPPLEYQLALEQCERDYTTHAERIAIADRTTRDFFADFFRKVKPELAFAEPTERSVSLIELSEDPANLVTDFYAFAYCDAFPKIRVDMFAVLARISGMNPDELPKNPKYKWPKDSDLDASGLADTYLRETPFAKLLLLKVPFKVPERIRFEHTHVLAGSGAGKTTLLTQQLMDDVFDERQPALIVIDGKGTWAPELQRFACFAPDRKQSERLVIR